MSAEKTAVEKMLLEMRDSGLLHCEDAKKTLGNGKFRSCFVFACQVSTSDFGETASIASFSAFATSRLRCSTCGIQDDMSRLHEREKTPVDLQALAAIRQNNFIP